MRRRVLKAATLVVIALPLLALVFDRGLLLPAIAVTFAVHAVAALATFVPQSQLWGPARVRFATDGPEVWLTIDDGPAEDTDAFLDVLDRHDARASFFVVGQTAERFDGHLRKIVERGHEIGCHTWSHPHGWFWAFAPGAIASEIDRCNERIKAESGAVVRHFRPPVGFRNGWTHDVLEARGLELVSWSKRGLDGFDSAKPTEVVERNVRDVKPGDILMIHQGRRASVEILERLLEDLDRRGLRCVIPA